MKPALALLTALLMISCSHARMPHPTPASDPAGSGRVVVIRNDNLFDWWLSVKATLDDAVVAHLRAGEHVAFEVSPGLHSIGVAHRGISVPIERGQTYYFLISADDSQAGFEIERLGPARGEEWVSKTKSLR